jgi:hypothetical protein
MSPNKYTRHPEASNYCILFGGYRKDSKLALSFEFVFILIHFLIGMVLGLLYSHPFIQAVIILVLCIILLIYTLAIRPFQFTVVLIFEIITQIILIIALIGLVISTNYEKSGCFTCANREGFLCYLILAMLFLYLLLLALGLLIFSFLAGCCGHKLFYKKKHIPEEIEVSGGQNLSGMAGIDDIRHDYTREAMIGGTMAGAMGGTMVSGYNNISNSNTKYKDEVFKKEVVFNEEINESYKNTMNENISEEDKELSQTEEVIIGKNDTLMESDEEEYRFSQKNRNERTMYEFGQDIKSRVTHERSGNYEGNAQHIARANLDNSLLDRTMTVKVDTDDERIRQNKVLHALSVSEINNQDIEENQNQVNQAKKVIEMNRRSHMMGGRMGFDDSDLDHMSRRYDRDTREFQLGHDYDGYSNRNVTMRKYEGGSDFGTEKEFLSDTNVVKTRVHSQAVRDGYTSGMKDGGQYYHAEEYEERTYNRNN